MCTAPRYLLYSHHNHNKTGRLQSYTKHTHTHTYEYSYTHRYLHLHRVCLPSTYIHTTRTCQTKNPSRIKIETFTKKESNRRQLRAWCGGVAVPAKLSDRSGSSTVLQNARISSACRVCDTVTNSPVQFGSPLIDRCAYQSFSAIACQRCLHTCGHTVLCSIVDGPTKKNENENAKKNVLTRTVCFVCNKNYKQKAFL